MSSPADNHVESWLADTRTTYDTVAESYVEILRGLIPGITIELGMLAGFAADVLAAGGGPVLDVGCGPGDVTAILRGHGLDVRGLDLSAGMLDVARRNHPDIHFEQGDRTRMPYAAGGFAGIVSWWSTVHLPADVLPVALAELRRVLRPNGMLVLGFHAGDRRKHFAEAYGHQVSFHVYRREPQVMLGHAADAGLALRARLDVPRQRPEAADQCVLILQAAG